MIEKANLAGKPVMVGGQIVESMMKAPRPSRQESTDILNAVLDGADCVMLSGVTAVGDYPINAVTILTKIMLETERTINYKLVFNDLKLYTPLPISTAESVATAVCSAIIEKKDIQLIVALTQTGKLARAIAKYRPEVHIVAASPSDQVCK